jgi:hypothetical protein
MRSNNRHGPSRVLTIKGVEGQLIGRRMTSPPALLPC